MNQDQGLLSYRGGARASVYNTRVMKEGGRTQQFKISDNYKYIGISRCNEVTDQNATKFISREWGTSQKLVIIMSMCPTYERIK